MIQQKVNSGTGETKCYIEHGNAIEKRNKPFLLYKKTEWE